MKLDWLAGFLKSSTRDNKSKPAIGANMLTVIHPRAKFHLHSFKVRQTLACYNLNSLLVFASHLRNILVKLDHHPQAEVYK